MQHQRAREKPGSPSLLCLCLGRATGRCSKSDRGLRPGAADLVMTTKPRPAMRIKEDHR
jgi:hypothetical protein